MKIIDGRWTVVGEKQQREKAEWRNMKNDEPSEVSETLFFFFFLSFYRKIRDSNLQVSGTFA